MFARGKVDNESEERPLCLSFQIREAFGNASVWQSSRVISGSTIVALGRGRRWQQALYLFDDMQRLKLQRNAFSFASAIGTLEGRTSCFALSWNFQQHVLAHKIHVPDCSKTVQADYYVFHSEISHFLATKILVT